MTVLCASRVREIPRGIISPRASEQAFLGVLALIFSSSAALTIFWSVSMSSMSTMPMPGGWSISMTWMRVPSQTWTGAAASFVGMWAVMMIAMMMPSFVPMLRRYRQALGWAGETRIGRLTILVGAGYFFVWTLLGLAVFPLGVALANLEMRLPEIARAVPGAVGLVVLVAGAIQFTPWKIHHLACARESAKRDFPLQADAATAWNHGLHLGIHCIYCCAGLTAIFAAIGIMDLRVMVVITAAITVERLAPSGVRAAQAIGVVTVGTGLLLIARAAGLG